MPELFYPASTVIIILDSGLRRNDGLVIMFYSTKVELNIYFYPIQLLRAAPTMSYKIPTTPQLYAFDLDGTILQTDKTLSTENMSALKQIANSGAIIAFASGRIKESILQYTAQCTFPVAILSLNGAMVYLDARYNHKPIYTTPLSPRYAEIIIDYAQKRSITLNYYFNDTLYSILAPETSRWIDLYIEQTSSHYQFVESFDHLKGNSPSKIILIGEPEMLDIHENYFKNLWKNEVYICRTWDYYLEFLDPQANKGSGLQALANAYSIDMKNVIAFGDAENDIPMLKSAGMSIAVHNASEAVKSAAKYTSQWNNDQHVIEKEWQNIQNYLLEINNKTVV